MKRSLMMLGAVLALSFAGAAAAMPDVSLMMAPLTISASPSDLGAGVLMASAALGVPAAEHAVMRAKLQVGMVLEQFYGAEGAKSGEAVSMHAVCKSGGYPEDGSDEDNTFAKFSPGASLSINIANPALFGKFKHGDKFYVDFTAAGGIA